jgi:hypothetical protein
MNRPRDVVAFAKLAATPLTFSNRTVLCHRLAPRLDVGTGHTRRSKPPALERSVVTSQHVFKVLLGGCHAIFSAATPIVWGVRVRFLKRLRDSLIVTFRELASHV